jgi:hypothetical protein
MIRYGKSEKRLVMKPKYACEGSSPLKFLCLAFISVFELNKMAILEFYAL